jgi:hypothetical protein
MNVPEPSERSEPTPLPERRPVPSTARTFVDKVVAWRATANDPEPRPRTREPYSGLYAPRAAPEPSETEEPVESAPNAEPEPSEEEPETNEPTQEPPRRSGFLMM